MPLEGARIRCERICCERMSDDLALRCEVHADRFDCPDAFIARVAGGYGLIVHDGGTSVVQIDFCPWCGSKLPLIGTCDPDADEQNSGPIQSD